MTFDPLVIRKDFPIFDRSIRDGKRLVYLDSGATSQKPAVVIEAESNFYRNHNAAAHRGAHQLAEEATEAIESAREVVANFLGGAVDEIVFTKHSTEALNLLAYSIGNSPVGNRFHLQAGDEIVVSEMEHHSNIVPWQMVAAERGATVEAIPVDTTGTLDLQALQGMLDARVRMVAVGHVSNALGTINPVAEIARMAHAAGALVFVDGAQAIAHWPVDVQALDCDFYSFSAHKLFGPTGIGVLYGRRTVLEAMPPYQGGGEMIESVSFAGTTYNQLPYKFEAGTPDIAGAVGLGAAIDYVNSLDREGAARHEEALLAYAQKKAQAVSGLTLVGTAQHKTGVMSFNLDGVHPADLGTLLDQQGVAVRTGNHCAQPIMDQYRIPGTVRASFSFYNTFDDVDRLFAALEKARQFLQ